VDSFAVLGSCLTLSFCPLLCFVASQIYDGDGEPVEMKIELEKEAANWGGLGCSWGPGRAPRIDEPEPIARLNLSKTAHVDWISAKRTTRFVKTGHWCQKGPAPSAALSRKGRSAPNPGKIIAFSTWWGESPMETTYAAIRNELVKDLAAGGFGEMAAAIVDALEKIIDARIEMMGRR
jgi:hypothetical protein